jgi:sulfite exporter TauE/SafE
VESSIVLVGSALAMGLVGEVHCAGMCGGIAAVTCGGQGGGARRTALVHLGRIGAYAAQGALAGALGALATRLAPFAHAQLAVRVLAGLALVAAGLHLAGIASLLGPVERLAAAPLRRARTWLGDSKGTGPAGELARGLAWGLLPCGLVQGAIALALASGSAAAGAATMFAFGMGTLPVLLVVAGLARRALSLLTSPRVRRAAGVMVVASGAVQLALVGLDLGVVHVDPAQRPCCAGKAR